jgi:hypothetical protein
MKIDFECDYEILSFDPVEAKKLAYAELKLELQRLSVDYNVHAIGIADALDGDWCINREDGFWLVYHYARGRRSGPSMLTIPFDAANFLLWSLVSTPAGTNISVGRLPILKRVCQYKSLLIDLGTGVSSILRK